MSMIPFNQSTSSIVSFLIWICITYPIDAIQESITRIQTHMLFVPHPIIKVCQTHQWLKGGSGEMALRVGIYNNLIRLKV